MPRFVPLVFCSLVAATLACGGGEDAGPTPTAATRPSASPTVTETPTSSALTDRSDCDEMRGTPYRSAGERVWFLANCVTPTPAPVRPGADPVSEISLPDGFAAYAIGEGFFRPTSIALGPDGEVYVSERHGNVYRLLDSDGDGLFERNLLFASGFDEATGLVVSPDGAVYVASTGRVTALRDADGDTVPDGRTEIISGLPHGRHQNNGLVFGPDGALYLTNGSTCDECDEADDRSATILRASPDGGGLRVHARGLRNAYDLVFDDRGRLWATDNGSDAPCATLDELNLIVEGGDYGWPYGAACDPLHDGIAPAAGLGTHTAATGIDYYDGGNFPSPYRGNLFVTLWGSLAYPPEGFQPSLLRVVIDGERVRAETFGAGFRNPIDAVVDRDGTLLVLDYGSGTLYRIVYEGG